MAMQPLRFAMVTTFYPPFGGGGGGRAVRDLSRALVNRGHRVDVIHDTDLYRLRHGAADDWDEPWDGVHVHRLHSPHNRRASIARARMGPPASYRDRLHDLMSRQYDVIHFHNLSGLGGPAVWSMGDALKLHSAHDHWLVCATGDLMRNGRRPCTSRRCIGCQLRQGRLPGMGRTSDTFRSQARHVDAFIVPSRSARKSHRVFGFDDAMAIVPPFLPKERPALRSSRDLVTRLRPYFLFCGPLDGRTGLDRVIAQMADLEGVELLISGAGPDRARLQQLARSIRNVLFLEEKSGEEKRLLMRGATAVVSPGHARSLFPDIVIEAFREGTPLIAGAAAPYPEIARDTGGAVICRTEAEYGQAFRRLLADRSHLTDLGRNAFNGFARLWREDRALDAYFGVIAEVAQRRGLSDLMEKLEDRGDPVATGTRPGQ